VFILKLVFIALESYLSVSLSFDIALDAVVFNNIFEFLKVSSAFSGAWNSFDSDRDKVLYFVASLGLEVIILFEVLCAFIV